MTNWANLISEIYSKDTQKTHGIIEPQPQQHKINSFKFMIKTK